MSTIGWLPKSHRGSAKRLGSTQPSHVDTFSLHLKIRGFLLIPKVRKIEFGCFSGRFFSVEMRVGRPARHDNAVLDSNRSQSDGWAGIASVTGDKFFPKCSAAGDQTCFVSPVTRLFKNYAIILKQYIEASPSAPGKESFWNYFEQQVTNRASPVTGRRIWGTNGKSIFAHRQASLK